eukprot:731729-Rhodomonas_salina.5
MDYMFSETPLFNVDLDAWDVRAVTSMRGMFRYTKIFNQDLTSRLPAHPLPHACPVTLGPPPRSCLFSSPSTVPPLALSAPALADRTSSLTFSAKSNSSLPLSSLASIALVDPCSV